MAELGIQHLAEDEVCLAAGPLEGDSRVAKQKGGEIPNSESTIRYLFLVIFLILRIWTWKNIGNKYRKVSMGTYGKAVIDMKNITENVYLTGWQLTYC